MSLEAFSELLIDINLYSGLIPIAVALVLWRYQSLPLKIFMFNLLFLFLLFIASIILQKNNQQNHFLNYLQDIRFIGCVCLMYYFYDKNPAHKRVLATIGVVCVVVVVTYWWFWSNGQWNGYLDGSISVITTAIASYFLSQIVIKSPNSLLKIPVFWISAGIIVTSLSGIFATYFAKQALLYSITVFLTIWNILSIIGIVCKLLYATGFYMSKQRVNL